MNYLIQIKLNLKVFICIIFYKTIYMQAKKKLNRKDFLFQDGWFQTKIKKPKQLVMQQFQISDCQQCNIFLFDSNACVYVDSCKYCNIFIGPSQSSIFIRDCQSINVISISQQFRVRDSFDCKFSIFCQSQPIIQSSKGIQFSCYPSQLSYKQLGQQVKQAKLNQWNNNWFDIYDFTPNKFNTQNYRLTSNDKQINVLKNLIFEKMLENEIKKQSSEFIPPIVGKIKIQAGQSYNLNQVVFLVFKQPIETKHIVSLIIQSKYVPFMGLSDVQKVIQVKGQKNKKVLFLKILKSDQSRWKQNQKLIKIVKTQQEKQIIQNIIFAPFKDQH